jgi:peptidoglycan/LPS O-acetylase OafA/YrhL
MTGNNISTFSRDNNFGALRLLFAALVIVCHSSILLDGGNAREPLFAITHTLTLGDIAVDGFFLVSGYLVLQSLLSSGSAVEFIGKRVLRVYPGYVVACLVSILLGAIAGGRVAESDHSFIFQTGIRMLYLDGVSLDGAYSRNPMQGLNGSLWTIAYEFCCYLCLLVLAVVGLPKRRKLMVALAAALLMWTVLPAKLGRVEILYGAGEYYSRFFSLFASGCVFYLYRDRIRDSKRIVVASIALLVALLPSARFCTASVAIAGGYLIFWFAIRVKSSAISRFANHTDLSYGVYLYGWPVTQAIIWCLPGINRWLLSGLALMMSACLAYLSWRLIEKPALGWKKHLVYSPPEMAVSR